MGRQASISAKNTIGIAQAGISQGKTAIQVNGSLEELYGVQEIVKPALAPEVAALRIEFIGLTIRRSGFDERGLLFPHDLDFQAVHHHPGNLILDRENILRLPPVSPLPARA